MVLIHKPSIEVKRAPCAPLPTKNEEITPEYLVNHYYAYQDYTCLENIDITTRTRLLTQILNNWVVTDCLQNIDNPSLKIGNCYEPIVYKLILSTPWNDAEALVNNLKVSNLIDPLFNKTQFSTFDEVALKLVSWIYKFHPKPDTETSISNILDKKMEVINYDEEHVSGSVIGNNIELQQYSYLKGSGSVKIEIPGKNITVPAFSYVMVNFKNDIGTIRAGSQIVMPAMQALYLFNQSRRQFFINSSIQAADMAMLCLGVGEVRAAFKAYEVAKGSYQTYIAIKGIADAGMGFTDVIIRDHLSKDTSPEGIARLERWNTICLGYFLTSFSATAIDAAITKLGGEIDNVQKFDNLCNELDGGLAKTGSVIDDATLDAAKAFDDNVLDVADVSFKNWKTFQNRVASQSKIRYPNSKIGNQITLDVTYVKNGQTFTKTIIPDNLVQIEVNGVKKYKLIDAKTSVKNDLTQIDDLTGTCTQNQQPIYKIIDGESGAGTITKVEMRGGQAKSAFQSEFPVNAEKIQINLENGVEFWVNTNPTDFTQYLIRPRIK